MGDCCLPKTVGNLVHPKMCWTRDSTSSIDSDSDTMVELDMTRVCHMMGGGPRVVVSTAAFHAKVRGSVPGLGGLEETKNVSSPSTCESQYCGEPP